MKLLHEFRDPIHVFIRADDDERMIIDSPPVQRLRQIHHLAMSYLVYPGTTHRRFEHSLGVMELAGNVFDVITAPGNVHPQISELIPQIGREDARAYWRRAVRMAALCHDVGHLPFSHATEDLLPRGRSHETFTAEIVNSKEMKQLWQKMTPPLRSLDVAKLAVGQKELKGERFTDWEALLSEIIVSDALGVDRMDYLLRDSLHAGVPAGRVDHFRLMDTIRILPGIESTEPELGIERGGLHAAEALLLARYLMFSQVYYHPVRVIYDIHLNDFLREWLADQTYPLDLMAHSRFTDSLILSEMAKAAGRKARRGHEPARRIVQRDHFKVLWEHNPDDLATNPDAGLAIFRAAKRKFGVGAVRQKGKSAGGAAIDFPVLTRDGQIQSAQALSKVLRHLPPLSFDYVFITPEKRQEAREWLEGNRKAILKPKLEE